MKFILFPVQLWQIIDPILNFISPHSTSFIIQIYAKNQSQSNRCWHKPWLKIVLLTVFFSPKKSIAVLIFAYKNEIIIGLLHVDCVNRKKTCFIMENLYKFSKWKCFNTTKKWTGGGRKKPIHSKSNNFMNNLYKIQFLWLFSVTRSEKVWEWSRKIIIIRLSLE